MVPKNSPPTRSSHSPFSEIIEREVGAGSSAGLAATAGTAVRRAEALRVFRKLRRSIMEVR
jgi:hypothetical protein